MTSRQKSCVPCAKSKRRCQPQTPKCPRCARQGLSCYYKNAPVRDISQTHARRGEDGISQLSSDDISHSVDFGSGILISNEATSPGAWSRAIAGRLDASPLRETCQRLCREIRVPGFHPACPVQKAIDKRPLDKLTRNIMSWPGKFVQKLEAPFIHPSLQHAPSLPPPLEGAFSACATYVSRTEDTKDIVMNIIERKVTQLISLDLSSLSIEAHLASLQAFLILHIIQLWDGDVRQRAQAELHSYTLESWALVLHMRVTEDSQKEDAALTWDRWIMLESARRTALMTLLAQGIFEMHKYGVCSYVPNMAVMPFTTLDGPWNAHTQNDWTKEVECLEEAAMANYYEYANTWKTSAVPSAPSAFGKLLLIPCLACTPRHTLPPLGIDLLE
ncbi:hypothetical protein F4820DRAFT_441098 [Hypoxylon rubiginosum]|uniref:Uncharacterized protein n=1 Tax=Hypoxylon rubiginosum TaxID=110542 RepID=A0ACB9YJ90_9PEZI|nr:hypothetical protein F4820DRAFT_441098 [Hypoxylon rubiginosum]